MENKVDREAIRSLVENFWRSFLTTAQSNPATSQETLEKFEGQIDGLAAMMPLEQASAFMAVVEEERQALFQEYSKSPESLKIRLGLLTPLQESGTSIGAHDIRAIIDLVHRDYADLQVIAKGPGSVHQRSEAVDRELDARIRTHVAKMSMDESANFLQTYNQEYNRIVASKLTGRQSQGGCAVVLMVGMGGTAALGYAAKLLLC